MAKPDTKYLKAIDVLRAEILGGKYSSAHPFPSIMGVSRRFAVSRPTAVKVFDRLKAEGLRARLVLQVHDELIVECPQEETEQVKALLTQEMEGAGQFSVPLVAEAGAGHRWAQAKG